MWRRHKWFRLIAAGGLLQDEGGSKTDKTFHAAILILSTADHEYLPWVPPAPSGVGLGGVGHGLALTAAF